MSVDNSVPLPYGLSDSHRQFRTVGKIPPRPVGVGARWHVPKLQSIATTSPRLFVTDPRHKIGSPPQLSYRTSKDKLRAIWEEGMSATTSTTERESSKTFANTTGESWRARTQPIPSNTRPPGAYSQVSRRSQPMVHQKGPLGPETRTGASKDMPITIDDDDDQGTEVPLTNIDRQPFYRSISSPISSPTYSHLYSTSSSVSPPPGYSKQAPPSVGTAGDVTVRKDSIYSQAQSNRDQSPVRQRRAKKPQTRYTNLPSSRVAPIRVARPHTPAISKAPRSRGDIDSANERNFTLRDISDYATRKKVADLMAVSPVTPVQDLYRLLLDLDGDLDSAREQTIPASRAPSTRPLVKRESPSTEELPQDASNPDHLLYGDEIMVKIDPSDPSLEWDTDAPFPKVSHRPRAEFRRSAVTNPRSSTQDRATKYHPDISVTRTKYLRSGTKRKASNTSAFIVPDDVDTDVSSSNVHSSVNSRIESDNDSDSEEVDAVPKEPENLRVDVMTRHNSNKRLMVTRKKR